jgi:hypothetical protein
MQQMTPMVPHIQLPPAQNMMYAVPAGAQPLPPSWAPQHFQYKAPISGYNHGTIATWVLDPQGRWLCRGCGSKNCCTISNCQHCGAQREITLIPVNQMNMTPVQLGSSPIQYQLPVYENGRVMTPMQQGTPIHSPPVTVAMPVPYSQAPAATAAIVG